MKRYATSLFLVLVSSAAGYAQAADASREATREQLRELLNRKGPMIGVVFKQSAKQPYNFVGTMTKGLANAESMEIVLSVTGNKTIGFRIFPHYNKGYINVEKAKNTLGLAKHLLRLSDRTFLFWGMDASSDVFAGYTFTLESGFPEASMAIVLASIVRLDEFVGELKPFIDGNAVPPK